MPACAPTTAGRSTPSVRERPPAPRRCDGCGHQLERTIDEVTWFADHGFVGTYAPGFIAMPGLPPLDDEYWDPLWAVYADRGLAVIVHGGYGLEQGFAYGEIDEACRADRRTRAAT